MRQENLPVHGSSAETATGNSGSFSINSQFGVWHLDVTAVTGTSPTLDITIEEFDPGSGNWIDTGLSFTQVTATGSQRVVHNPVLSAQHRAVWTIGGTTPSFTFSLAFTGKGPL